MAKKKTRKEELIDELLNDCTDPKSFLSADGPMQLLQKRFYEKALEAEMDMHLGYSKHSRDTEKTVKNSRNGFGSKTLHTDSGSIEIATPRDRDGSFSPEIVAKESRINKLFNLSLVMEQSCSSILHENRLAGDEWTPFPHH